MNLNIIENNCEHNHDNKLNHKETKAEDDTEDIEIKTEPEDWKPQEKCYFCVDGKLLKVNEIGELVVESGPVLPDTELNKQVSSFHCCCFRLLYLIKLFNQ